MLVKQFEKAEADLIGREIEQAVQMVAEKYGIKIVRKAGSYSRANYTLKLECSIKDAEGLPITREVEAFKINASKFGLDSSDLGAKFSFHNEIFILTGLATGSWKFPILAKNAITQKPFKFPAAVVQAALGKIGPNFKFSMKG